jgi:hypothetical protein
MTVKEYNEVFYPQANKAFSFVNCMDHALQKSDDNARMQMKVIGWDEDTKAFLLDAISRMQNDAKDSLRWSMSKWWKENTND